METVSPRISIVTSTFNAAAELPYTIHSIREQTSRDFEWIVVDGNSTDGTQALLHENDGLISHWISEPDQGIYDAWNKACKMTRGEWLRFLGAGDELAGPHTLAECLKNLDAVSADTTIVYGRQTLLSLIERTPLETSGVPWADMKNKWEIGRPALPPHGSTFQRKKSVFRSAALKPEISDCLRSAFFAARSQTPRTAGIHARGRCTCSHGRGFVSSRYGKTGRSRNCRHQPRPWADATALGQIA